MNDIPRLSMKSSAMVSNISSTSSSNCSLLSISATSSCSRCLFNTTTEFELSFSSVLTLVSPFVWAVVVAAGVVFEVVVFEVVVFKVVVFGVMVFGVAVALFVMRTVEVVVVFELTGNEIVVG